MNSKAIEYDRINETMYEYRHSSGLMTYVLPKKGYSKKYATFGVHYGSINSAFTPPGEQKAMHVPDGIAHFLEHKLFEQKDGSVMDKFSKLGSNPNAYTSFNQTVYLFSCTDRFDENFHLLLDFVQNPYITEESVEKEKGIIGQEIQMYQDDPGWRVFFNLLDAFYENNPVKLDIAGTRESISKITRETLYQCYNTFYTPSNMVIFVVGDVDPQAVFEMVEKEIGQKAPVGEIQRIFPDEKPGIHKSYVEQKLAVSMPLFYMGCKDNTPALEGMEFLKREVAVKLLLGMLLGKSSVLYNELYAEGLINSSFEYDYTIEENYAYSMFGGESPNPQAVRERIAGALLRIQEAGLDQKDFERVRRAMLGRFLRQLNSVERISHNFLSVYFKNAKIFDYPEVYDKINFEYVEKIFREHFHPDNMALSVIKPG